MRRLDERGETLVEVVMALAILSLVLVSSYALATSTFRQGRGAGERTQAVNYLQQQAEALRTYRNGIGGDWHQFAQSVGPYTAGGSTDPKPGSDPVFCMTKDVTSNTWKPVPWSESACVVDGVTLFIVSGGDGTTVGSTGDPELYNFKLYAKWTTASEENNATITTKLVRQQ